MPVLSRRRYTDACKTEAVRLVSESGPPVAQVARELGIPDHVRLRQERDCLRRAAACFASEFP
jgi:transposase